MARFPFRFSHPRFQFPLSRFSLEISIFYFCFSDQYPIVRLHPRRFVSFGLYPRHGGEGAGAINVQPGNVQPWWIRYALVLFQEGRDFDSLAFLRRVQAKFEGVGEVGVFCRCSQES